MSITTYTNLNYYHHYTFGHASHCSCVGDGTNIIQPLGIAVSGGLFVSTIFTLIVIPIILSFVPIKSLIERLGADMTKSNYSFIKIKILFFLLCILKKKTDAIEFKIERGKFLHTHGDIIISSPQLIHLKCSIFASSKITISPEEL